MLNSLLILIGKLASKTLRTTKLGHGSTWPGHFALSINKHFVSDLLKQNKVKVVIVAGTNGKTTTTKLIRTILEADGKRVLQNHSGANLLNGIASALLLHADAFGNLHTDYALFETDENTLPALLKEITPEYVILLNLFRDQLDRYGEVNTIARRWKEALKHVPEHTKLILNADDPLIAFLGTLRKNVSYFGYSGKGRSLTHDHAVDSVYCPKCGEKLHFKEIYFSHLGVWGCPHCKLTHPNPKSPGIPKSTLLGTYNEYNVAAAVSLVREVGVSEDTLTRAISEFKPAFGRQEVVEIDGRKIQFFLSKNPTGFNESLRTISQIPAKHVLFLLNDRIPDGRDVSWIWDVDFEEFVPSLSHVTISGDRCFDMGMRIKYAFDATKNSKRKTQNYNDMFTVYEDLREAIDMALQQLPSDETLYILPTYSAMLETRQILTGKSIL